MGPDGWHIAFVGLPGAGKSTVARLLAERLERPCIDFDEEIERRAGATIASIFATRGEAAFRDMEAEVTRELVDAPSAVLSPGGGWVTRPEVVACLRPRTILVWLRVSPQVALRRMGGSVAKRPLLMKGDPRREIEDILADREGLYRLSDLTVDTEVITPQQVASEVARLASDWSGRVG